MAAMGVEWDHGSMGRHGGRVRGGVGGAGRAERAEGAGMHLEPFFRQLRSHVQPAMGIEWDHGPMGGGRGVGLGGE